MWWDISPVVPSYIRVDLKIGRLCVDLIWSSHSLKDRAFPTWWWKNIPKRFQAWRWHTVLLTVWWWRRPCEKECRRACARRDWQQQRNGDFIPTTARNWILPKISMSLDVNYSLELLNESTARWCSDSSLGDPQCRTQSSLPRLLNCRTKK